MISAVLGGVIMSAATIAMLVAIDITTKSLDNAGKYPLTTKEKELLIKQGLGNDIELINSKLDELEILK